MCFNSDTYILGILYFRVFPDVSSLSAQRLCPAAQQPGYYSTTSLPGLSDKKAQRNFQQFCADQSYRVCAVCPVSLTALDVHALHGTNILLLGNLYKEEREPSLN